MHVLIVAPEAIPVPPIRGGSVEICILAIAKRLAKQHRVTIVSRQHFAYPPATTEGNLTILRVPAGSPGRYIRNVLRRLRGQSFDWIQVDNRPRFIPKMKAAFSGTPVSLFLHSLTFVSKPMIARPEAARCLTSADLVVANSASLKNRLSARFPDAADKIRIVHLGVDLRRFRPPTAAERRAARRKYGLGRAFAIVFAGRIIPRKGIPVLIKAVAKARRHVPRAALVIAGGTGVASYGASLKRLASRLGVPTVRIGYLPHRRMHRLYWLADCFVCPSQGHEAFGLVNVEAMASGVPCIASNNGGIKEIVRHGCNGLLIKKFRDPRAFAAQIVKLAKHPRLAGRIGRQGRGDAESRFHWQQTADGLTRLYGGNKT